MDGRHRLLIALVVGVTTGETEPLCFWIMAVTCISCIAELQAWWAIEDGWAAGPAVASAITPSLTLQMKIQISTSS
jgi:hypothetical protein